MREKQTPTEAIVEGGEWRIALADAWEGWLRPVSVLAAAGVLALAYLLDWFSEPNYARLLVALYAAVVAGGPAIQAALSLRGPRAALPLAMGLAWAAVFVVPVWWTLSPGEPLVAAPLQVGESLQLAAAPGGQLTARVDAPSMLEGEAKKDEQLTYDLVLETGESKRHLKGEFSRKKVGKPQRGGLGADERPFLVHAADLHTLAVTPGQPVTVRLARTKPAAQQPLVVALYAGAIPWTPILVLLGAALLVCPPLSARWLPRTRRSFLPHVGAVALTYALVIPGALDPMAPVKPLFGALLVSLFAGVVAGEILTFLSRRMWKPRA